MKKDETLKENKVVKKVNVVKKPKALKEVKTAKIQKAVKEIELKDITEHEWKMKSNVHVRILSESKPVLNPDLKILYATKAEVKKLEKESDTLVITISFEGEIKENFKDTSDDEVKI